MPEIAPWYFVILRHGLPPEERSYFERYAYNITTQSGASLLLFVCSEVDVSHHSYIAMKTSRQDEEDVVDLRIPHHYVLAIYGSRDKHPIGFV